LFVSFNTATNNTIKEIDESISRMEDRLVSKEARMRAQFRAMEQLMAQFQSQSTAITNLNNQFAANNRR
jgi:flagellar capping protein FliD